MRDALPAAKDNPRLRWLKRWIWIYFWLIIFEGSLRKWVFPSFSAPLLLVRDPVVLIIYFQAARCGKFKQENMWPFAMLSLVLILLATAQIVTGANTVLIAIYGLRSYALHLPLLIVMAETLTAEDLRKFGIWLLIIVVPMTALMTAQYYAPPTAWLNLGAGVGAGQILSAGGHIRPAGTFSYGIGFTTFTPLVAAFAFFALFRPGWLPRWLAWAAIMSTIVAVPFSGSRTVLFIMLGFLALTLFTGMARGSHLAGIAKLVVVMLLGVVVALQLPFVQDAVGTFTMRWQQASHAEGDTEAVLDKRVLAVFEGGLEASGQTAWLGNGIGMGSLAASFLQTGGQSFMLAEMEWERTVLEFGPIFGLAYLGMRVFFALYLVWRSFQTLGRGNTLPWLLLAAALPGIVLGGLENTTVLGLTIFSAGLCLSALNRPISAMRKAMNNPVAPFASSRRNYGSVRS
jgi:hypothetical protein